ncbi:isoflavone reductase homolog, partial [Primulina tabacum]|uniref:isoflavone reductase homolog n=1 Tax=Primulina tabacum TaxID=48773 RepID=UPI003F59918D
YIGKFIVEAAAKAGHPTFILVRDSTLSAPAPQKSDFIRSFKKFGVTFVLGDLYDHESLFVAIRKVDNVISTVGYAQLPDQEKIVAVIKEAGNVKMLIVSMPLSQQDQRLKQKGRFRCFVGVGGIPFT